jgi:hypothetical protein
MAKCAVCGKEIGPEGPGGEESLNSRNEGVCDAKCRAEYDRNPERYGRKTVNVSNRT